MARKILATFMVILGVSAAAYYLYYTPAHLTLSIIDPPPQPYDTSIQAIQVTFTKIEIHAAKRRSRQRLAHPNHKRNNKPVNSSRRVKSPWRSLGSTGKV